MTEFLAITFAGGIVGALFMDVAESVSARAGITSGVNVALVGRWAGSLARGVFHHRDIRDMPAQRCEIAVGWLFHLFIGGGAVALALPLGWQVVTGSLPGAEPWPYLLFGLATSALPWFILLPSFGWGLWGRNGPEGRALLASVLSHIPYGLGIWVTLALAYPL